MIKLLRILILALLFYFSPGYNSVHAQDGNQERWYRGNTHTHARFSDKSKRNDVPKIVRWYKRAGYDFLVLSEHNRRLKEKKIFCHAELKEPGKFIMLCGLEMSESRHHTAVGIDSFINGESSLQDGVSKTIAAGGFPILNHPQAPVITAGEFLGIQGLNHIEIFNGKRRKHTDENEVLWDSILSSPEERAVYAVAADDNHYKKRNVGRGWIMVRSDSLTDEDIEENIRTGNFYASTGIFINEYAVSDSSITIESENGNKIEFYGRNGLKISTVDNRTAIYHFKGDESYVRAKITNGRGRAAWTQPVYLK